VDVRLALAALLGGLAGPIAPRAALAARRDAVITTWPGWVKALPAFCLRRSAATLDRRRACAQEMLHALGPQPSPADPTLLLRIITDALAGVTAVNAHTFAPLVTWLGSAHAVLAALLTRLRDGDPALLALQRTMNTWGPRRALVLAAGPNWLLRLAVWRPDDAPETMLHTHPFTLVTTGVVGPGYRTDVYSMDRGVVVRARVGDRVQLLGPVRLQLTPGRTLVYYPDGSAHLQLPPDAYSVSLNLMVDARTVPPFYHRQFFIDPATRVLRRTVRGLKQA
jgi:hypothetical protein